MNLQRIQVALAFGPKSRSEFYEILANFIADGMPAHSAIGELHRQFAIEKNPIVHVTEAVMRAMAGQSGKSLTPGQALAPFVPAVEAMAIDSGADSGKLADGFLMAKRLCETQAETRAVIAGEVIYPLFLLAMFLGFFIFVGEVMLPVMADLVPREKWPPQAQILGWLGDNSKLIVAVLTAGLLMLTAVYFQTKDNWTGSVRSFCDKYVFPWNVACSVNSALLLSAIAIMLRAGVPFNGILDKLGRTSGAWLNYHFALMRARMRRGSREGDALAVDLYDKETRWQIQLYGKVHNFADGIDRLSVRVVKRVLARVKVQFAVIRFGLMVGVAGMIVWVYWAFLGLSLAVRPTGGLPM